MVEVYGWIWRHLPGPLAARYAQCLGLFAVAVALLFLVIFPRVERLLPYTDVTVNRPATGAGQHPG